jgi:hypothetical protein
MNSKKINLCSKLFSLGIIISLFSGCAKYRAKPLKKLFTPAFQEQTISFDYHILNKQECKKYLDRDVMSKGYQPIHLTIVNNSNRYLNLSLDNFSLLCISPSTVAKSVHFSTAGRAAGYTVASILTFGLFLIPAVVDGVGSSKANKELDADFEIKSIKDRIIAPHHTINGLIFTPKEGFDKDFSFVLVGQERKERFILSTSQLSIKT